MPLNFSGDTGFGVAVFLIFRFCELCSTAGCGRREVLGHSAVTERFSFENKSITFAAAIELRRMLQVMSKSIKFSHAMWLCACLCVFAREFLVS